MDCTHLDQIREIAPLPAERTAAQTDADLLGRFLDQHDQGAFRELVARHLPTVHAVCRSVLRDSNG